jgi:predicted DNA-binding protein
MARNKTKNSDAVSFRIRKDISERLNDYSELSRIPKTAIVEMALEEYLSKVAPIKKDNK